MSGPRHFPPVGDPARLDAILSHGRTIRRRRRAALTTSAGAVAVVVVLGVVVASSGSPQDDNLFAAQRSDTTTSAPTTPAPKTMTVTQTEDAAASKVEIVVRDPSTPVAEADAADPAKHCVLVTLTDVSGKFISEDSQCVEISGIDIGAVPLEFPEGGAQVGCSAVVDRDEAAPESEEASSTVEDASSTFEAMLPEWIVPGDYQLEVVAVSGIGDGCEGTDPLSTEIEHVAKNSILISIP